MAPAKIYRNSLEVDKDQLISDLRRSVEDLESERERLLSIFTLVMHTLSAFKFIDGDPPKSWCNPQVLRILWPEVGKLIEDFRKNFDTAKYMAPSMSE